MKTISPTAMMLTKAIEDSDLTQREIADRVGFKNANIISMLKNAETRVPLERIPALATTLGMDEREFLMVAIEEYHPGVHEVLVDVMGVPLSDAELAIITMFRMSGMRGDIEVADAFRAAIEAVLALAAMTRR